MDAINFIKEIRGDILTIGCHSSWDDVRRKILIKEIDEYINDYNKENEEVKQVLGEVMKENEQLKARLEKLESIISWLTDGDNDSIEGEYETMLQEEEDRFK